MPDLFCKVRYFRIGQEAPKNSCFKGTVTSSSIFGGSGSYFNYCERYVDKENKSLMSYTGRYGFTMTSEGYLDTKEKSEEFKAKGTESLNKPGAVLYEFVVSMPDYDRAGKYSLASQEQFAPVISSIMPVYLKSIGLDPNNISWWEDFHPENRTSTVPHPHIHLLFFENEPSGAFDKSYGKLPKKAIDKFKSMFGNEMLKREDQGVYRDLFNNINESRRFVLDNLKHTDLNKVKTLKDLYAVLPKSGRLQINSANMAPYRETVFRVVDELLNSKECRKTWDNYLFSLDRYERQVNRKAGSDISSRKDLEISKLKDQIANYILSSRKGYIEENSYGSVLKNRNYKISEGNRGKEYKDASIVRGRLSTRNSTVSTKRAINGLVAKRQREIENEIDQYLHQHSHSMSF